MGTTTSSKFYSFSDERRYFGNVQTDEVLDIYFYMDYRQDSYEMSIYSFWDMIGIIGGVYEVTKVMLGLFFNFYSSKLMKIDLINSYNQYTKHEDKPKEENDPESRRLHRSQRKKRIKNRSELSSNFNDSKNYTY